MKQIILLFFTLFCFYSHANDNNIKNLDSNIRVIALGDPTHFEGTINNHRSNLINTLISEKGFNLILFESNIYEVNIAFNRFIASKNKDELFKAMYWMFKSKGILELFTKIEEALNKGQEIRIGGFDTKFTGQNTFEYLKQDIENQESILSTISNKNEFYGLLKKIIYYSSLDTKMNEKELVTLEKYTDIILQSFQPKNYNEEILKQCFINLKSECYRLKSKKNINNVRDLQMSKNIMFFLKDPTVKIILWGSSTHFIKNSQAIYSNFHQKRNFIPLGHHLDKNLTDKYFFIAYSSLGGIKTNLLYRSKIKKPKKGSAGYSFFENMTSNEKLVHTTIYKDKIIKCRILGHRYFKMNIDKVCDAIYFLKDTEPFVAIK
jgi:erythromycin esterase